MKKKLTAAILIIIMIMSAGFKTISADNPPIGTDIGDILATDIIAKVNGYVIPAYNIDNSMIVYAKHLRNYGFDVAWDAKKRQVYIKLDTKKSFEPILADKTSIEEPGKKIGDILYTDIKTFINDKEVQSFNINGSTAIYFRDLKEFGSVSWDEINRVAALTTSHPDHADGKIYEPSEVSKLVSPAVVLVEIFDAKGNSIKTGSGFLVSKTGIILTNEHVINNSSTIKVKLIDGRSFAVKQIIQSDAVRDIAVLKIDGADLPSVKLGDSDKVENGEKILTIGSPVGLENTITDGLISNRKRIINKQNYFQISAPISSGSSGGALLNYKAEVIGMTTATIVDGQNLNLAIPINEIKPYIDKALSSKSNNTFSTESDFETKTISYGNGDKYEGQLKNGKYDGKGTYTWKDGKQYTGQWENGKKNGYGEIKWTNGLVYKGNWLNDSIEGDGTLIWSDGERHVGIFKGGYMHGKGTRYLTDGKTVSGIWYKDKYICEVLGTPKGVWAKATSSSEITLNWDKVPFAEYYHVYYSYSKNGPFVPFNDSSGSIQNLSWNKEYSAKLKNMKENTTVYFKIKAVLANEESASSITVAATTMKALDTPTGVWAKAVSGTEIKVGWSKVADADYYYLYYSYNPSGPFIPFQSYEGVNKKYKWYSEYCVKIVGIEYDTSMYFKVTAVRNNEESAQSSKASATTLKR